MSSLYYGGGRDINMLDKLKSIFHNDADTKKKAFDEIEVLVVDSDDEFLQDLRLYLETNIKKVYVCDDGMDALEKFNKYKPDIVIASIDTPKIDGIELSKLLKNILEDLPIILLTDTEDPKVLFRAMEAKVNKIILKSIKNFGAILDAIEKISLSIKNNCLKETIDCKDLYDPVTMVYNKEKLKDILSYKIDRYKRFKNIFSVLVLNVSNLKKINEKYGYKTGDKVLKDLAQLLHSNTRSIDSVGRWNEDNFIIILPETSEEQALKLVEKLREKISNTKFEKVGKISTKCAIVEYQEGQDIFQTAKEIDDALSDTLKVIA